MSTLIWTPDLEIDDTGKTTARAVVEELRSIRDGYYTRTLNYATVADTGHDPSDRAEHYVAAVYDSVSWSSIIMRTYEVAGDAWYGGAPAQETADAIIVPGAFWGDYSGSVETRAAWEFLVTYYAEYVIRVSDAYGYSLAMPLDFPIPLDLAEHLADLIEHGSLELETWEVEEKIVADSWDSWMARDFREAVSEAITGDAMSPAEPLDDVTDEELLTLLRETLEATESWEDLAVESGSSTDAYLRNMEEHAECVAEVIMRPYLKDGDGGQTPAMF